MDESHEELEEGQVSRRDALKKMAAGAVGFWAVPIISSFRSPAFAQVVVSPTACVAWDCNDPFQICGTPGCGNIFPDVCLCDVDTSGNQICWNNFFCSDSHDCTSNADCSDLPGWVCTNNCCGTTCAPPCGTCPTSLTTSGATGAGS